MLLSLDPVLDSLTDESIGRCSFNVLNAEIAIILLILCWRISLLWTLMIDDMLLCDNRPISHSLEVLLMRWQEGIIALWHFR